MKKKDNNRIYHPYKLVSVLLIFIILTAACFKGEDEPKNKNLIPEKTFVSILKELHLSNGLFSLPKIRSTLEGDTSMIYVEIIESHGYSKESMDTTLQYYFIKKPKKLIKIYDQILGEFTALQSELQNEIQEPEFTLPDKWKGVKFLDFPGDDESGNNEYELVLSPSGFYSLRFTATVFPDDQSFNPCCTAILVYSEPTGSGTEIKLPVLRYIKDGQPHDYKIEGSVSNKTKTVLKGSFYNISSDPAFGRTHARIENISFFHSIQ